MKRIRPIGLALVAMFALSAFAASAASAVEGPFWKVEGNRLKAGEERLLLASASKSFVLTSNAGITITCTGLKLPVGNDMQIVGSTGTNAGTSREILEFTGCTQVGNKTEPECIVANGKTITTNLIINTLGYASATRGGPVLVLFAPSVGKTFVTIKFSGTCTVEAAAVQGTSIGEARVGGVPLQIGSEVETLHGEVNFTQAGKTIWTEAAGALTETKAKLEFAGLGAKLEGTALITVDLKGAAVKWGVFTA